MLLLATILYQLDLRRFAKTNLTDGQTDRQTGGRADDRPSRSLSMKCIENQNDPNKVRGWVAKKRFIHVSLTTPFFPVFTSVGTTRG